MLSYDLSRRGDLPRYVYLYQCIRDDIISGRLACGERLPSKRMLAQHLDIGVITVANAYQQLQTEGYIVAQERRGYFVPDLSHLRVPETQAASQWAREPVEHEFFVNFRANRASLKLFPAATWNQLMRRGIYQNDDSLFRTVPYNGLYDLRAAIAHYLELNRGMQVTPSQVIIGAGTEYLYGRLTQLFGRACTFGFENPGYRKLASITNAYGNPCKHIPIDESGLMVDRLEESGADVVHVSPANHFPTGIVMPISRRVELFEWASRAHKRFIIEDDYDSEFRYRGTFIPPLYVDDTQHKVIYMNTFSKTMVPSLRISYMVLPPVLLQLYKDTMSFYSCTVSSFEQYALAAFISEGYFERHVNRIKNHYHKLRLQMFDAIAASKLAPISEVIEHDSGTHFLLAVDTALSEDQVRAAGEAADMRLTMYCDFNQLPTKSPRCTLVINYAGIEPEKIEEVIHRLEGIFPECGS